MVGTIRRHRISVSEETRERFRYTRTRIDDERRELDDYRTNLAQLSKNGRLPTEAHMNRIADVAACLGVLEANGIDPGDTSQLNKLKHFARLLVKFEKAGMHVGRKSRRCANPTCRQDISGRRADAQVCQAPGCQNWWRRHKKCPK